MMLALVLLFSPHGSAAVAQQPSPSLPPCARTGQAAASPPPSPTGLTATLDSGSSVPFVAVQLQWNPVPNAACITVEKREVGPIGWFGGLGLPGNSTEVATNAPRTGESCFRLVA